MGVQDVAFLPSRDSFLTTFIKIAVEVKTSKIPSLQQSLSIIITLYHIIILYHITSYYATMYHVKEK